MGKRNTAAATAAAAPAAPDQAPANVTRGETSITLESFPYVMRPSFEAIDEFEVETGKSVGELYNDCLHGRLRSRELAAVVGACVRAKGRQDSDRTVSGFRNDRIREILCGETGGLLVAGKRVTIVLLLAATGGVDSEGKAKAVTTTTSPSPPAAGTAGSPE